MFEVCHILSICLNVAYNENGTEHLIKIANVETLHTRAYCIESLEQRLNQNVCFNNFECKPK